MPDRALRNHLYVSTADNVSIYLKMSLKKVIYPQPSIYFSCLCRLQWSLDILLRHIEHNSYYHSYQNYNKTPLLTDRFILGRYPRSHSLLCISHCRASILIGLSFCVDLQFLQRDAFLLMRNAELCLQRKEYKIKL